MNTGIEDFDSSINHVLVNGIHRKTLKHIPDNLAPIIDLSGLHLTNQFGEPYTSVIFIHSGNVLDACTHIELYSDWSLAE